MTRNDVIALWIVSYDAGAKYNRNLGKAQLASISRYGRAFEDFEPLLARLKKASDDSFAAALEATKKLTGWVEGQPLNYEAMIEAGKIVEARSAKAA